MAEDSSGTNASVTVCQLPGHVVHRCDRLTRKPWRRTMVPAPCRHPKTPS